VSSASIPAWRGSRCRPRAPGISSPTWRSSESRGRTNCSCARRSSSIRSHLETDEDVYAGTRKDTFRPNGTTFAIARRQIHTDQGTILGKNLAIFFKTERKARAMSADETWEPVGSLEELASGERLSSMVGDEEIVLCRVGDEVFALLNWCTHGDARLSEGRLEGTRAAMPRARRPVQRAKRAGAVRTGDD